MKKPFQVLSITLSSIGLMAIFLATVFAFNHSQQNTDKSSSTLVNQALAATPDDNTANFTVSSGSPNPFCTDNYETWTTSSVFKTSAPWSIAFVERNVPGETLKLNNFERDINGDGLPDYIFSYHISGNPTNSMYDCVYLSNGHGWDLTYRCVAISKLVNQVYIPTFYGDCAG